MGKHPKPNERREARRLRAESGMPMKRIASRLGVSPSSVYLWTRDIRLSTEQRQRNLTGPLGPQNPRHIAKRVEAIKQRSRDRRRSFQNEGRLKARQEDPLHLAGCMLYWAEGSKGRNSVQLCNSDLRLLSFFRRFVSVCFDVPAERFRLALHVYLGNGLTIKQIEQHWLQHLSLPRSCLTKHQINPLPTSSSGKKKARLPYGVCRLTVHDTRIVQHIYGAIQEYAGFDEPRWLD